MRIYFNGWVLKIKVTPVNRQWPRLLVLVHYVYNVYNLLFSRVLGLSILKILERTQRYACNTCFGFGKVLVIWTKLHILLPLSDLENSFRFSRCPKSNQKWTPAFLLPWSWCYWIDLWEVRYIRKNQRLARLLPDRKRLLSVEVQHFVSSGTRSIKLVHNYCIITFLIFPHDRRIVTVTGMKRTTTDWKQMEGA